MCGICGAFRADGPLAPDVVEALPAMTDALAHRGPDQAGAFADAHAALGHRRLAVIGVSSGRQPLANEDGTVRVVFNGEIYNHRDLRKLLAGRGHRFATESDTEAIVHAYEELGPACVERLHGMFAFALYDAARRRLLLARDRLGKKPLFYLKREGTLVFASEIKALRRSPLWDGALDLGQVESYLCLTYIPAPDSIYRSVRKLEPATTLLAGASGERVERYWDIERFGDERGAATEGETVAALREEIERATRARLESEVPLGAFLSGGVDSGLVVAMAARAREAPLSTTTVGFGDPRTDELERARATAARYGTRHRERVVEPRVGEVLDRIVAAFDEPFADPSAVPTWYLAEAARADVTVALSGDGGDEAFAGYDFRYVPHALEAAARGWVPPALFPALGRLGTAWPAAGWLPRPLRLGPLLRNVALDPADAFFLDLCFTKPPLVGRLLGKPPDADFREMPACARVAGWYRRPPVADALTRAQYADLKVFLPDDVLTKVDRMSMAHALEVRSPLLDHAVVERAFGAGAALRMPALRAKRLLKEVARGLVPDETLSGPKRGFTPPLAGWLRGEVRERFEDEALGPGAWVRDLLDAKALREVWREHLDGLRDHSYLLWAVFLLERWRSVCEREVAPCPVS